MEPPGTRGLEYPEAWEDRTLSIDEVMRRLGRLLLPITVACLGPYLAIWGWPEGTGSEWITATLMMLAVYLVAVVVHEALHVLPMFAAGLRPADLRFGIRWSEGVVFVHGTRPVSARHYRVILATPGLLLGLLPLITGWVTGSPFLTVFAWLMVISAIGDWAVLRLIGDLEPERLVQDHPRKVGCLVEVPRTPPE